MASLQASLRSQYAQTPDDIPGVLRAVNRTFYESTPTSRYATLFFGVYDEQRSQLRYANCGHPPPVLLCRDGSVERLQPTGHVLGLFEELSCTTADVALASQDTLVMFTDGSSNPSMLRKRNSARQDSSTWCDSKTADRRQNSSTQSWKRCNDTADRRSPTI